MAADPEGECPDCAGTGWVVAADGGAGAARPCACRSRDRASRLLETAGIPPRYQACSLANFETAGARARDQLVEAQSICRRYVEGFLQLDGRFREGGLLFIGPPGVGKTHLAVAVLRELVQRYSVRGRFVDFTTLIHQIQSTFDPGSYDSKQRLLDPVTSAEVLVLDELGAQKPTPFVNDTLYLVMNERYTRRLPTLFTTNYRLGDPTPAALDRGAASAGYELLANRLPPVLVSRLSEMAQPVRLDAAEDFRRTMKTYHAV